MKLILGFLIIAGILIALIFHTNVVAEKHYSGVIDRIHEQGYECDSIFIIVVDGFDHLKVRCLDGSQYNLYGREVKTMTVIPAPDMTFIPGPLF